jgi:hypothetical protein
LKEKVETLEEADELFIACDDIPDRLCCNVIEMDIRESYDCRTMRITPIPVNIVFAGENG